MEAYVSRSLALLGALMLAATATPVFAQQSRQQPSRGPEMALALEAAQAALAACAANGVKVAASIVDSAGGLRVLLTADGAAQEEVEISRKKAFTAVALKEVTSAVADRMEKDQPFKAKIETDKNLFPRPGGIPLMVGGEVIGAIGVSGASRLNGVPGGVRDQACAKTGLDKISSRLK
jgi:uncharacterized protein GlcG (DUF336 family)